MKITILGLFAALTLGALAEETKPASVRLIEAMDFEAQTDQMSQQLFDTMFRQLAGQGIPEAAIKEIGEAANDMMRKSMIDGKVSEKVAALYEERFSEDELEELIIFYQSPIGSKMLAEQTFIANETAKVTMEAVGKNQADFQNEVAAIIGKHLEDEPEEQEE